MSPDPDVGLLKDNDDDGPRVAAPGGHPDDCHPRHPSTAYHGRENDSDCSLSSDSSATYPIADRDAAAEHATAPLNPDSFYKSYRGLQRDGAPQAPAMAPSAARLHGDDGIAPRPSAAPANYALSRPNARSVSSPVDGRSPVSTPFRAPTGKPSVKDLKKRFDQNGAASSVPRAPARQGATPLRATRPTSKTTNGTPASPRAGDSQDSPPLHESAAATRVQRSKFVARAAPSASSQSFASRIGKPRGSVNGSSKSMTHLPHRVPPQQPSASPPSTTLTTFRSPGLLFGEIPPGHRGASIAGFGIQGTRPRRTSESSPRTAPAGHHRSLSGPDAEPPSPSSWYRQVDDTLQAEPDTHPRLHARSRSDASPSLARAGIACKPPPSISASASPRHSPPASKLPVSVRKLSSTASSTSPSSTRSNSPSTYRCSLSLASARVPGASPAAAASRAAPPVARAKTPTGRKPPPLPLVTPDNHARLPPHLAAHPPKSSPPLRSSRPRLPVSSATTASSRMKGTAGTRSRDRPALAGPSKADDGATRRRKISVGPIDFEQRREHIRLAYSKSIRESEVLEARHTAAEKRRKEAKATAKPAVSAKATAAATAAAAAPTVAPDAANVNGGAEPAVETSQPAAKQAQFQTEPTYALPKQPFAGPPSDQSARPNAPPPLTVRTTLGSHQRPSHSLPTDVDSPTLGLPGSFPAPSSPERAEAQPLSALSTTSETTEFDVEPQTNPPIQPQSPLDVPVTIVKPPSPRRPPSAHHLQAQYRYPFEEELDSPERPSVGSRGQPETAPTTDAQEAGDSPRAPVALGLGLLEPKQTFGTKQAQGAVITILLPAVSGAEGGGADSTTTPFPRLEEKEEQAESDCHSDRKTPPPSDSDARQEDDAATDACTEETDDRERTDCRRSDSGLDQLPSHRTSTCASSDTGTLDDVRGPARDAPGDRANPLGLSVPHPRPQNDRLSQQSAWTDFSVDSADPSDGAKPSATQSRDESPSFGHATIFESKRTTQDSSALSSRDASHSAGLRGLDEPKNSPTHVMQPQLPEVDTGDGFFVPYLSPGASASLSFLPSPEHEPPPIPNSTSGSALNSRASSVFYDQSYYGSTLINSEREADGCTSPLQTPQSMDMPSMEAADADQYFGNRPMSDGGAQALPQETDSKERHRLMQRRNVIKELVDTEAVFVRDMNIVEEIYKGTAEACPKLDSKTVKLIFRNSDEIIHFHTCFLGQLKEAVASVYVPAGGRTSMPREESVVSEQGQSGLGDPQDGRDRATSLGPIFQSNVERMKMAHEGFLRNSDQAAKRLIQIQQDPTVQVWLNECNEVAKDLTAAWDLDSLLIKPMQRITKYPNLIITLLQHTPQDHPDREALVAAKESLETAIIEINKTKKNFELVGQIVGRKRKESDVKAGFARAFGKRVDKLQASNNRPPEDADYVKLNEKFGDDYLRLQVVLRDVEFYTRQVSAYVHEFLQYLSSIELVMRLQPGNYPELESKWVQFNISVRDLEKVALEEHLTQVRKHVIEPFELVIRAYGNPSLAMKKRQKRRLDYERAEQLKRSGKTADPKLRELVEQYEALNDTLKKELPVLSSLTEKVGNICLGNLVNIQTSWYGIWKDKMRTVLGDCAEMPDLKEVVSTFQRDYPYARDQVAVGVERGRLDDPDARAGALGQRRRGADAAGAGLWRAP
ncbi:hypothetical protein CDD83_9341 [Cordyceps sp. RAO-2017]|nr:hypothetical protein CDD83_9341 [Cordyceps sp. RAO-2017]